jgi:hypothetical protein
VGLNWVGSGHISYLLRPLYSFEKYNSKVTIPTIYLKPLGIMFYDLKDWSKILDIVGNVVNSKWIHYLKFDPTFIQLWWLTNVNFFKH